MSVTIEDLMRLPCLREARVAAGKAGLSRTVNTITVLEYTFADNCQESLYSAVEFAGDEIVISCFAGIKDDVAAQCVNLRRLSDAGEAGLILYYVGIIVPALDGRLVALADSLGFPLIVMPENRPNLRYSEVITEVMEAVFKDHEANRHFQAEILERLSRLSAHLRSVGTAMAMISDRLKASIVLTDGAGNVLNSVCWPRAPEKDFGDLIARMNEGGIDACESGGFFARRITVATPRETRLALCLIKQGEAVDVDDLRQTAEALRICLNLWSGKYGEQVLPELVQAILHDEPFRMRHIAAAFKIDVASIHNMVIVTPLDAEPAARAANRTPQTLLSLVRGGLSPFCKTIVADIYHGDVIAFFDDPAGRDLALIASSLSDSIKAAGIRGIVSYYFALEDTTQARRCFLQNKNALATAALIYPRRTVFNQQEVCFAETCLALTREGEERVNESTALLRRLDAEDGESGELALTLEAFLLDAGSVPEKCAELIHKHPNSVRYRLNRVNEILGFKIGSFPETMEAYRAVALRRLMRGMGPAQAPAGD